MIQEQYVTFEVARLLEKKGFDEGCSFVVNVTSKGMMPVTWPTTNSDIKDEKANLIAVPTQQMAMRWLREVHHLHISVQPYIELPDNGEKVDTDNFYHWDFYVMLPSGEYPKCKRYNDFQTYEDAAEEAIKYCLERLI